MSSLELNIKLNYLYRDFSNYKQFGSIVFTNPSQLTVEAVTNKVLCSLIDGEYFEHTKWGIPSLFFDSHNEDDHNWHEFEDIVATNESPTDKRTIEEFISQL